MFRHTATLFGSAGIAFLAGSFAPAALSIGTPAQSHGLAGLTMSSVPAAKADRLAKPLPAKAQSTVSTVELVGIARATVILRDHDGRVLYRMDPETGVTSLSKDTQLPVITLKEQPAGPVVQHPALRREGNETPQENRQKRRNPVGCLGDVSPLAKASADRTPSLCVVLYDHMPSRAV